MASSDTPSPHVEFYTPSRQPSRDKPSPLRIVKRSQCKSHLDLSSKTMTPLVEDSPDGVSEFSDRRLPLKIVKRRGRHNIPAPPQGHAHLDDWEQSPGCRPTFWASSVELSRPRGRIWEETLTRCRGLLSKSRQPIQEPKQPWAAARLNSRQQAPSWYSGSSACSSLDYSIDTPTTKPSSSYQRPLGPRPVERPVSLTRSLLPSPSPPPPVLDFSHAAHPSVLSPHISVLSQSAHDGKSIWATVEVSGRLSRIPSSRSPSESNPRSSIPKGSFVTHQLDRFFEYGCLYDLTVEVLPTSESTVMQVVQEQAFPTTIYAGSSVVLLLHIQLHNADKAKRRSGTGHIRQRSDELIEDLELELGNSEVGYMHVRVSYSHSAFPVETNAEADTTGVSHLRSRMETTATAILKRPGSFSAWSCTSQPLQDHLLPLLERHWGPDKAVSIRRMILGTETTGTETTGPTGQQVDLGEEDAEGAHWERAATVWATTPTGKVPVSLRKKSTPKAFTFGVADGRRAQRTLLSDTPSNPPSLRSRRSSEDPQRATETPTCLRIAGTRAETMRASSWRVETSADALTPENMQASMMSGRSQGPRQGLSTQDKPGKDIGFWNWGMWF
ncbi:hypothetical protein HIM_00614 [Hirsutella minnesotensis 3608]|nr:hypothetical protein HIM_00614 [Hirsutella minnesotensis 3608]